LERVGEVFFDMVRRKRLLMCTGGRRGRRGEVNVIQDLRIDSMGGD
jgi:hypothetical protein